jgi:hypothetical protein
MKNERVEKNISMIKLLRDIRDKMSIEIQDMNLEELKAYFKKRRQVYTGTTKKKKETV